MAVPARIRATPPVYKGPGMTVWYQPANTRRDIPRGLGGQHRGAMDDFLLSPELQGVLLKAASDIEDEARGIAAAEGVVESGDYLSSFGHKAGDVVVVNDGTFTNPRVSAEVTNDSAHAAAVEFGNKSVGPGKRILGKAGARFDTPKGSA